MKLKTIVDTLGAKPLYDVDEKKEEMDIKYGFATDLMSNVLATVEESSTVLLTGLANSQSLRTAEMLDIRCIVYVRARHLVEVDLELAKDMGVCVYSTDMTMFEACGRLYEKGLSAIKP